MVSLRSEQEVLKARLSQAANINNIAPSQRFAQIIESISSLPWWIKQEG